MNRANLLTLSAVVAVALGLGVVAVREVQAKALRARSARNLAQVNEGMQAFVTAFGFFPSNGGPPSEAVDTPDVRTGFPDSESFRWGYADPKRAGRLQTACWAYSILPYVGEEEAFRKVDHTRAVPIYYMPERRDARPQAVPKADPIYPKWTYQDAGLGPWGRTDYAANDQVVRGGMGNVTAPARVTDGLAATALVIEKAMDRDAVRAGGWYWDEPIVLGGSGGTGRKGDRLIRDASGLVETLADQWGSPRADGVHFLFCDGGVRLFSYKTDKAIVAAAISPRGGEKASHD